MFNHSAPPFKGEPLVIERRARYQNDQHDEMSSLVPRSAPYEHSKCAEWPKCSTIQPQCSTPPFKRDNFPIQHHKIHQNVQLNEQRKMHPLRPPELSQQPNQQHIKQYVQSLLYWRSRSSRHGKCPRTMNMISLKTNSLVFSF